MVNKKASSSKMMEEDLIPETDVSQEFINFFLDELKDIYWAEKHVAKALPKISKATSARSLKDALAGFLSATQLQAERLEQVFELLGETPRAQKCEAMAALVEEANAVVEHTQKGRYTRDAGIVSVAQKVEHYEIATYATLVQLARTMGNEDIISLLEETLSEKKETGKLLNAFIEGSINAPAAKGAMEKETNSVEKVESTYDSVNLTGKNTKK